MKKLKKNSKAPEDRTGQFYASNCREVYNVGPHRTRAAAIKEFKAETGESPRYVGVAQARYIEVDGERLIEDLMETAPESLELYEDAMDGWCDKLPRTAYDELSEQLTVVLHRWLAKHQQDRCWNCIEAEAP